MTAPRGREIPFGAAPGARRAGRIRGAIARQAVRNRRALLAIGVLAAVLWPAMAPAADRVEEVVALVAQERLAEARRMLEPLLEDAPVKPRVRLINGILRAREGYSSEAIAIFESLGADYPDMFEPHNNLAVLYADQGRLEAARGALITALERKPDAVVYANLGDIYTRLARRAYDRARNFRANPDPAAPAPVPPPVAKPVASAPEMPKASDAPEPVALAASAAAPSQAEGRRIASSAPPESDQAGSAPSAALSGECVRAGEFRDRETATKAAQWMQSRGAELLAIVHEPRKGGARHWVHLPPSPSRKAAAATVAELGGKGVRDVAIMRKGADGYVVSLGVFRNEKNMRRRVARLNKLGYPATASPRGKTVSRYVVRARAGTARAAFDGPWASRFPGHSVRYIDCPVAN